jgi:hypothetical protein
MIRNEKDGLKERERIYLSYLGPMHIHDENFTCTKVLHNRKNLVERKLLDPPLEIFAWQIVRQ